MGRGGSHAAAAAAAVLIGRTLLPVGVPINIGGRRGWARLHLCFCRSPRVRCFGTNQKLSQTAGDIQPELLDRNWMLSDPGAKINQITLVPGAHGQQGADLSIPSFANNSCPSLDNSSKSLGVQSPYFYVVRDDLLHPLLNGNKARKLDAVMPILEEHSVTDVIVQIPRIELSPLDWPGSVIRPQSGLDRDRLIQSSNLSLPFLITFAQHNISIEAVACAERGMTSHLLLRGEQPEIPTGYNLVSLMYGDVTYIARSAYTKREEMLSTHASLVAGDGGSIMWLDELFDKSVADQKPAANLLGPIGCRHVSSVDGKSSRKVVIIREGAGDVLGLLGVIRLVKYLSQAHLFGEQRITIVLDAGTGTTAVGLGIGAICLGLPWKIVAVMLADSIEGYRRREKCLISDFKRIFDSSYLGIALNDFDGGIIHWVERTHPRRFGHVQKGEVEMCREIAKQTGILVDPVYTLAAWEQAVCRCEAGGGENVVMLHTGGTLGMFGLAQRYKSYFHVVDDISG